MNELTSKLENYKIHKYGCIAKLFRRGILNIDEAMSCWDDAENEYFELKDLIKNAHSEIQQKVLIEGLTKLFNQ